MDAPMQSGIAAVKAPRDSFALTEKILSGMLDETFPKFRALVAERHPRDIPDEGAPGDSMSDDARRARVMNLISLLNDGLRRKNIRWLHKRVEHIMPPAGWRDLARTASILRCFYPELDGRRPRSKMRHAADFVDLWLDQTESAVRAMLDIIRRNRK